MKKHFLSAVIMAAAILFSGCGNGEGGSGFDNVWGRGESSSESSSAADVTAASSAAETTAKTTAKTTTAATTTTTTTVTTTVTTTTPAPADSSEAEDDSSYSSGGNNYDIPNYTPKFNNIKEQKVAASSKGKYTKMDSIDYYYNNLDDFHKFMYLMIYDVCAHANVKDYKSYMKFSEDLIWDFSEDFYMVFACVMDDNPEFYPFDETASMSWNYAVDKYDSGYYRVYTYQTKTFPGYEDELGKLEEAAYSFLSDIDRSGSEYDVALRIHDKLVDTVAYNKDEKEENDVGYSQTAYGALVNHRAVCEGYSDAFSYLARWCGIMVLPIEGGVGSASTYDEAVEEASKEKADHTWNLMLLDGKYYEADVTWDDFDTEDHSEYALSLMKEIPGLIDKRKHLYWAVGLSEMRDIARRDEFIYHTDSDGETYSLAHGHVVHLRASDSRASYYSKSGAYNYRALSEMLPAS